MFSKMMWYLMTASLRLEKVEGNHSAAWKTRKEIILVLDYGQNPRDVKCVFNDELQH